MAAGTVLEPMPPITRVGFDHGWLLLGPTFLNLGVPLLLVDQTFLPDTASLGLEVFGTRNPATPLPAAPLQVERSGRFIGLRDVRLPLADPVAIGVFADPTPLDLLAATNQVAIAIGDTWAAQQSWSELWTFAIGIASTQTGSQPAATAPCTDTEDQA